jgi:hypothetical protein
MSIKTVAPYATKDLSVPIGQKIAISTNGGDNVTIWYQTDAGVSPVGWYVHDVIVNEEVLLGTFTGVQGVRIETQSSPALYDIGVSPAVGVGDASTLNGYTQDATATADTIALRDSNGDITANAFESTVATGTAPLTVASITKVANLNADLLDDLNTATASTASTVAARDASGNLTANVLVSDVAIGTAPLTVTSTTVVPNLNADQADGYDVAETATVSTIAARDASGDITANAFESTVATGTAPLTVASITKVANLNADLLDDLNSATASTASTIAARDASGDLTANVLISDVAGGTAPLTVTSTTVVPNLNADQADGYDASETSTVSTLAARDASANLTANVLISDVAGGTAPLTVTSTTKVANLNADLLDDLNSTTASTASTIAARDASGDLTANVLVSDVATGTAPLTVTSTTKVANLNADLLDDLNSATASTASTIAARDASGDLTANVLISDVAIGTAPLNVTSTTVVPNLNADQADGYNASETSTVSTLAARDASANLTANVLVSDVAIGTAPLTVTSTTKVANLNVDLLDDLNSATASTASTIAARDASGDLTANVLISDVAVGTAPLTVTSTTVVPNLNVDQTDGYDASETSTVSTLAARDASGDLTANVLISDVATGTAPLTVTSTTVVPNLNVSSLSGLASSQFLRSDTADTATGLITFNLSEGLVGRYQETNTALNLYADNSTPTFTGSEDTFTLNASRLGGGNEINLRLAAQQDIEFASDANNIRMTIKHSGNIEVAGTTITAGGYTVWHQNNDGSGSGLDADTVDGEHLSNLAKLNGDQAFTGDNSFGDLYLAQGAQTAKTTSTTLTAAEINTGIITVNNGAAGTTTLTLPLATSMDSQFSNVAAGYSWDFSVVNISTTAAEDADVGTNTGWTLVGNMDIEADDDPRARSSAKFRARKTGAGAWTLYRMA